jgi:hypothetical protein
MSFLARAIKTLLVEGTSTVAAAFRQAYSAASAGQGGAAPQEAAKVSCRAHHSSRRRTAAAAGPTHLSHRLFV